MDLATILGLLISFGLIVAAILFGGNLKLYLDLPAFLIVFGGSLGATLSSYPLPQFLNLFHLLRAAFTVRQPSGMEIVDTLLFFANKARREGILSIQNSISTVDDAFLRKALQLTVDGLEPEAMQDILDTEIQHMEQRHETGAEILSTLGLFAPAMGLIGTLLGLVMMLKTMNDPATIGPAMAVALLATLYGAASANLLFLPLSNKLKQRSRQEVLRMDMVTEGALAISRGENPRLVEEKLLSFLPPKERKSRFWEKEA
jgi:chemotaxis protein MotA